MKKILTLFVILTVLINLFPGCLSSARISDYPRTAGSYDFNKIANSKRTDTDKKWNSKTGFEYYIKIARVEESELVNAIIGALKAEEFVIKHLDEQERVILAERGLRANEWKSVIGIYYQKDNSGMEVYLNCKISQDITGGWKEDRAEKVANRICLSIGGCEKAYSVKTM